MQNIFDKKNLTERDICTKFITPSIVETAGWDRDTQLREELSWETLNQTVNYCNCDDLPGYCSEWLLERRTAKPEAGTGSPS